MWLEVCYYVSYIDFHLVDDKMLEKSLRLALREGPEPYVDLRVGFFTLDHPEDDRKS